jgi:hypothetical protein
MIRGLLRRELIDEQPVKKRSNEAPPKLRSPLSTMKRAALPVNAATLTVSIATLPVSQPGFSTGRPGPSAGGLRLSPRRPSLPRYVALAFEGYLGCGDLARGFLRCHCDGCGHDVLVAFWCKGRGLCPSCGARRMCNGAAMLVDRVLPNAPLRQWVLSLPFELRGLAAMKPDVLGAIERIFAEEIERLTKRLAGIAGTATGSVGFPQRFGSSLNLHVPLHTLAIDGVFEKTDGGGVLVHEAPPPSKDDVDEVAQRVRDRALRWLRRHGYLDERAAEERGNEPLAPDALDGCVQLALALRRLPRAAGGAQRQSRRRHGAQGAALLGIVRRLRRPLCRAHRG